MKQFTFTQEQLAAIVAKAVAEAVADKEAVVADAPVAAPVAAEALVTLPAFAVDRTLTVEALEVDTPVDSLAPKALWRAYNQAGFRLDGSASLVTRFGAEGITWRVVAAEHERLRALAASKAEARAAKAAAKAAVVPASEGVPAHVVVKARKPLAEAIATRQPVERTHIWVIQGGERKGERIEVTEAQFRRNCELAGGRLPKGCGPKEALEGTPAQRKAAAKAAKAKVAMTVTPEVPAKVAALMALGVTQAQAEAAIAVLA